MTEQEESERRTKEFATRSALFMEALDVDEYIAQLLATEGFETVEEVAFVDPGEVARIEGFNDELAADLQSRAQDYLKNIETARDDKRRALGVSDDLAKVPGVTTLVMVALGENGVKTVEDFADCATDDLVGWVEPKKDKDTPAVRHKGYLAGFEISRQEAEEMIMKARVLAGWITEADLEKMKADAVAAAEAKAEAEAASAAAAAAAKA